MPCLNHELGRPLKSNPPWDYEWGVAELPIVHLGPQVLLLYPQSEATQAGWKRALAVVATCGLAMAEAPRD